MTDGKLVILGYYADPGFVKRVCIKTGANLTIQIIVYKLRKMEKINFNLVNYVPTLVP